MTPEAVIQELVLRVDLARGSPTLLLCLVEGEDDPLRAARVLRVVLRAEGRRVMDLGESDWDGPSDWVARAEAEPADVHIIATPRLGHRYVEWRRFIAQIYNGQREHLRDLSSPLILVLHRQDEAILREEAPDFLTWAARTYVISPLTKIEALAPAEVEETFEETRRDPKRKANPVVKRLELVADDLIGDLKAYCASAPKVSSLDARWLEKLLDALATYWSAKGDRWRDTIGLVGASETFVSGYITRFIITMLFDGPIQQVHTEGRWFLLLNHDNDDDGARSGILYIDHAAKTLHADLVLLRRQMRAVRASCAGLILAHDRREQHHTVKPERLPSPNDNILLLRL